MPQPGPHFIPYFCGNKTIKQTIMKKTVILGILLAAFTLPMQSKKADTFPDGTPIPAWFKDTKPTDLAKAGKNYVVTDYGVSTDSTRLQTSELQAVIDLAARNGGGVITIPKGTFLSSALFFKQGTHLHLAEGAVLKGSDDISDFPLLKTRMEGRTITYFPALVNADNLDGFTISGQGTLNGNGLRYWKSFWLRRKVNPKCTNIEELRPRLIYISHCNNVQIEGIRIKDSPFWSTHYYKSKNIKLLNLRITSPAKPVKAPSTDAIDIDACENMLIKGCYMSVNDDAIALKGGKGPTADKDPDNGGNRNILVEDCTFGFSHGVLTCGSESIFDHNILVRNCTVDGVQRLFWLKMRPDTPQEYRYITFDNIKGNAHYFLFIAPWTQFFDMNGVKEIPKSYSHHITMKNINFTCDDFFHVIKSPQYDLSDFTFENLDITTKKEAVDTSAIRRIVMKNVKVNGRKL